MTDTTSTPAPDATSDLLHGGVTPTLEQFSAYAQAANTDDGPVVMANLLAFDGDAGRQAYYEGYGAKVLPMLDAIGAHILWGGAVNRTFIGTDADEWDELVLVWYPSRAAFLSMVASPEYQQAHAAREEGLARTALLDTTTMLHTAPDSAKAGS